MNNLSARVNPLPPVRDNSSYPEEKEKTIQSGSNIPRFSFLSPSIAWRECRICYLRADEFFKRVFLGPPKRERLFAEVISDKSSES